ncbi:MAG: helix-turn-helix transcriptional regulator [Rhodobacter sp.]|nr:helix-turn-helix transcriptional regulator [Rhodobacter sp.]
MSGAEVGGPLGIARAHWGAGLPDWVARLAGEVAASSQNRVARRLGLSASVLSQVLRNKYPGSMANVEDAVRAILMRDLVDCPTLGALPRPDCAAWRRKARRFVGSNGLRVRMYRACSRCPHNRKGTAHVSTDE